MTNRNSQSRIPAPAIERLETRRLLSDAYEPNNTLATATDFGTLGDREEFGLQIEPGDQDFFRFTALGSDKINIRMSHIFLLGDLDLYLYHSGTAVAWSYEGQNLEEINYDVVEGQTYIINVAGVSGSVNNFYDLLIDGPDSTGITPDRFEPNDSFDAATDLGMLGDRTENDLSIHENGNDDYFKFIAAADGEVTINLTFQHSQGDLDMILYDSNQGWLNESDSAGDNESIVQSLSAGQLYYLRVFEYNGGVNPQYHLSIDGQDVPAPGVTTSSFAYEVRQQIQFNFDQDVSASIDLDDLTVTNETSGEIVPADQFTLEVTNPGGLTSAIWKANSILPDGNYLATLTGSEVSNGSGVPIGGNPTRDFFVLAGDANRDRKVDVADLGILASNWQQSPRTFSQGNFDLSENGLVDVNDLGILASSWQKELASPSAPFAAPAPRTAVRATRAIDQVSI